MQKTESELRQMGLGELIAYADEVGCRLQVMNDLVTEREVVEAVLAHEGAVREGPVE